MSRDGRLTTAEVAQAWRDYDAGLTDKLGLGVVESFPAGVPEDGHATALRDEGLIYLANALALHPAGWALGVDSAPGPTGLFVTHTDDPEGITFDELSHEQGLGRVETPVLAAVLHRVREVEQRLARELDERARLRPHTDIDRGKKERLILAHLNPDVDGPATIETLADMCRVTRAEASSAIMRLGGRVHRRDDGRYELTP